MVQNAYKGNFDKVAIELLPHIDLPDISREIQQTLARLLAWDNENELFRLIQITESGGLVVSLSGDKSTNYRTSYAEDVTLQTLISEANTARYEMWIQNIGNEPILWCEDTAFDVSNTGIIMPQDKMDFSNYLGAIYIQPEDATMSYSFFELSREDLNYGS